jgi:hypothetical protein
VNTVNADGTVSYAAGEGGNANGAALSIYTDGAEVGTASTSGGGGDKKDNKTSSTTSYTAATSITKDYAAFVIGGYAFGLSTGDLSYTQVTTKNDGTAAISSSTYVKVVTVTDGAYQLLVNDPPEKYNYFYIKDGELTVSTVTDEADAPAGYWTYNNDTLAYVLDGTTWYVTGLTADGMTVSQNSSLAATVSLYEGTSAPSKSSSSSSSTTVNEKAPIITKQPVATSYGKIDTDYAAPVYTIEAKLSDSATTSNITFTWYVDGEKVQENKVSAKNGDKLITVSDTLTATMLQGLKVAGIHTVYCTVVSGPDKDTTTSNTVNFIVASGVKENSFISFSDLHETFSNLTVAINDTINLYGGMIPALIVCTGDWADDYYSESHAGADDDLAALKESTYNDYILRITALVGGIDIVFVAGNHDNSDAARDASIAADLGADIDENGVGVIYNSNYDSDSVGTSAANDGLIVFGINFDALVDKSYASGYSYDNVLPKLEAFLEDLLPKYNGELVVISSHAGLHKLSGDGATAKDYNINNASKVVELLNEYGQYMDILFLFGHDHSKGESELFLEPGETITTVKDYNGGGDNMITDEVVINFSYGHAGYITDNIGGKERYSFVTWNDEVISRIMTVADGTSSTENDLTKTIDRVVIPVANATDPEKNYLGASLSISDAALLKILANYARDDGSLDVLLTAESRNLSDTELLNLQDAIAKLGDKASGLKYGAYLDISLIVNESTDVTETDSPLSLSIEVPDNLYKTNYKYSIIRYHNGVAEILDTQQDGKTLTFETDQFSLYVLAYEEITQPAAGAQGGSNQTQNQTKSAPKTGDETPVVLWAVVLLSCTVGVVALVPKTKKH